MAFKRNKWEAYTQDESNRMKDGRPGSSAFQSIDKKNKQKLFSKKASDLRQAWKGIKDPNSNRAKQLKREAKTIGLTLEQSRPGDDDPAFKKAKYYK
tara:strand:+ start:1049 stop:1339 length:291 start_codon:yes stop_codon:yes gene_type:complete